MVGTVVLAKIKADIVVVGWPSLSLENGLGLLLGRLMSFLPLLLLEVFSCRGAAVVLVAELSLFLSLSRARSISVCFSRNLCIISLLLTLLSVPEELLNTIVGSSNKFSNLVGTSIEGTSVITGGI